MRYSLWNYGNAAPSTCSAKYGLPRAISTHNAYHLWGPGEYGRPVIAMGSPKTGENPV